MVHASASVNRNKARKFLTMPRPGINTEEIRKRVFFMITLFKDVLLCDDDLSDETRGFRLESMVPDNRQQAARDRLFLVALAVTAVRTATRHLGAAVSALIVSDPICLLGPKVLCPEGAAGVQKPGVS
jgi:hypothetical protein